LLGACSDTATNQFKFNTKTFDEARVNRYFKESSEAEQLALLEDLFVHNYDNKEVFENWVRKNLVAKNQVLEYRVSKD
jgi:hypothetical protein